MDLRCPHEHFDAAVQVATIQNTQERLAQIQIRCIDCGMPFEFKGLRDERNRIYAQEPFKSHDGLMAYLPLKPFSVIIQEKV